MSSKNGFFGFLMGGMIGAAIALLYAPRSGDETRQILVDNSQEVRDKTIKSMQETQDKAMASLKDAQSRLEELNKEVIARINTLQDIGQKTLKEQKENLEQGLDEASEVLATEESSS